MGFTVGLTDGLTPKGAFKLLRGQDLEGSITASVVSSSIITASNAQFTEIQASGATEFLVIDASGNVGKSSGGASGSSGTSGTSGSSGTSGLTGSSGTSGTSGSSGTSGVNGTSGSSGTSGTSGSSGTSGTSGSSGTSGLTGSSGTSGTSGSSGTSGVNGTSGSSGTSGTSGSSGTSGTSGSSGTSGTSGSSGTSGANGTSGTSGLTANITGNRYIVRATADENGEVEFNASGDIQFYTTDADGNNIGNWVNTWADATLNSDGYGVVTFQSASVTLVFEITQRQGSYSPWDFDGNFVVGLSNTFSDGDEVFITNFSKYGESGTSGSSGTSGTSGSSGTSGLTGSSGTSGANGTSGTSGSSGTSGANGTSGTSGSSGTSGKNGTTGTSGSSGTSGTSGSSGTSGTSGSSGTSGISGSSGTSGTSGSSGTSGTSGSSGTSGANGTSGTSVSISGPTVDGVLTSDGTANGAAANANLTFDGTELVLTGEATITDSLTVNGSTILGDAGADAVTINAATISIPNVAGGTSNTAIIKDTSNRLKTRTIDSRVWGSALVDAEDGSSTRVAFFSDLNTISGSAKFTYSTADDIVALSGTMNASQLRVSTQGTTIVSGSYGQGSRIFYGQPTNTVIPGYVYYFQSTQWVGSDADTEATSKGFMAVATNHAGDGDASDGMLIEGVVVLANDPGGSVGDPVYLSTAQGRLTTTQPGSGKIIRVMGYKVATNTVYFKPSADWIKKT